MSEIILNISIGDALDKLSILKIKLVKIQEEERKCEVIKELALLEKILEKHKHQYEFHFKILEKINQSIWNKLVEFRKMENDELEYGWDSDPTDSFILNPKLTKHILHQNKLFKDITNENDNRYRVKNKINILCNSALKEQKGYKLKNAFVLSHLGLGDNICMIGVVRYLATKYDKVKVVCKNCNQKNLQLMYADDVDIELYLIEEDHDITSKKFEDITKDYDTYIAGHHIPNLYDNKSNDFNDLPFNFYDDMKIDRSTFWEYHHISNNNENNLYNKLLNISEIFIFIHSSSSNGQIFTLKEAEDRFNFDCNDILVINPCENVYKENNKFYKIAEQFVNHPLIYYKTLIEKASKLIMSDSSFFCFSLCLKTDAKHIHIKPRDPTNYNLNNLNKLNKYTYWLN